jgi:Putative Zn-dependent protease, contains TPR repeats
MSDGAMESGAVTPESAAVERARFLMQQGRYEQAEQELRQAVAAAPDDAYVRGLLATALGQQEKKHAEALQEAQETIRLAPDWPFGHFVLALVHNAMGRHKQAEAAIRESLRLDPLSADAWGLLAQTLIHQSRWREALEAADRGVQIAPEDTDCINLRAMALVKLRQRDAAGAALDSALARDPENAATHANRGWALLEGGKHKEALTSFREALRLEPQMEWAREGIVEALRARNPLYRLLLGYFFWMSRLSPQAQWGVIIGGVVGSRVLRSFARSNPDVAPYIAPILILYAVFVFLTWTAKPLFNLLLRLDPFGRLALSKEQITASNAVGGCLLAALVFSLLGLVVGSPALLILGIGSALLILPISGAFSARRGTPRLILGAYTAVLGILLLAATALLAAGNMDTGVALASVYLLGFFLYTWVGAFLLNR